MLHFEQDEELGCMEQDEKFVVQWVGPYNVDISLWATRVRPELQGGNGKNLESAVFNRPEHAQRIML